MRTFALAVIVCLASLAWAKGGGTNAQCAQKCDASIKLCEQQCTDRFPKDKQVACKHACTGSAPSCEAHCRGEK